MSYPAASHVTSSDGLKTRAKKFSIQLTYADVRSVSITIRVYVYIVITLLLYCYCSNTYKRVRCVCVRNGTRVRASTSYGGGCRTAAVGLSKRGAATAAAFPGRPAGGRTVTRRCRYTRARSRDAYSGAIQIVNTARGHWKCARAPSRPPCSRRT